jgi:hypothetical protein
MRLFGLVTVAAISLAGCDTRPLDELTYAEQQEMLQAFTANCAAAGVTKSDPRYHDCVQAEINAENAKRGRQSSAMVNIGNGMAAAGDNYSRSAAANRPVTCTTRPPVGWGSVTTTCY